MSGFYFGPLLLTKPVHELTIHIVFSLFIQELIAYLDFFVYGVGIPGVVMVVVIVTTIVTTLKLRKAAAWRSESSSGAFSSREVALTKMLIGSSILFIICVSPTSLFRFEI